MLLIAPGLLAATEAETPKPPPNVALWDTGTAITEAFNPAERAGWKPVPPDLMLLEKNPPKASSDPGYYGREYAFDGDAVVDTPSVSAVFQSAKGSVGIYTKAGANVLELGPVSGGAGASKISQVEVIRNADDEIVLRASFSGPGTSAATAMFVFDRTGIVEVRPEKNLNRVRLSSRLAYGIVPGFIGDDLIFGGSQSFTTNMLALPSENLFLGLLPGEASELVVTWPKGNQRAAVQLGEATAGSAISALDFEPDALPFYLAVLNAPGIWHKEGLTPDFLEMDVKIGWKRPFPAKWKTQLFEEELKTTFAFRESRGEIWRGVAGSYIYPVWFAGEEAYYHLGKKVQPKGESLIYCLEGRGTPPTVATPADILEQTLGRRAAAPILDFEGRKLRTHHRRGGDGVRRACTCGCTEAIQAVFETGEEVSQKQYIQGALDDMIYFVHRHVERINEYRRFCDELLKKLESCRQASPGLAPFLDQVEAVTRQIPQECENQKENMKSFAYADELLKRTMALTEKKDAGNLKAYMELLKEWREMGGAQDYVLAKCHVITRNLCQTAGYGCAVLPAAAPLAQQIRAECRQVLRNPDGYEIWADY